MKYTIIEDCSPFYIRFTHDGLDEFVDLAKTYLGDPLRFNRWVHYNIAAYDTEKALDLLSKTPVSADLTLRQHRVSYFVSGPGLYYRAHKDGFPGDRYSINYPILVDDDKCITSWYSDEDLAKYRIDNLPLRNSRECLGFDKTKHVPIKTMTAKVGECILFNTEIYHDFDNSDSSNRRVILTFRDTNATSVYFEDARKSLFGY